MSYVCSKYHYSVKYFIDTSVWNLVHVYLDIDYVPSQSLTASVIVLINHM